MTDSLSSEVSRGSTAPEVVQLIAAGESSVLEFKASLRFDVLMRKINRELVKAVAKAVAGFLNTTGGTLLIGVSDTGTVLGIEQDLTTMSSPTLDAFERTLRTSIANYLGVQVGPTLGVAFVDLRALTVVRVTCPRYSGPVFFLDGDRQEFYIRDGNQTRTLSVQSTHEYIRSHWDVEKAVTADSVRESVLEALREHWSTLPSDALATAVRAALSDSRESAQRSTVGGASPPWIRVGTRRVPDLFLSLLARSSGWKRVYLISPWISDIAHSASLTSEQLCRRLQDERTIAYVVTRPPEEEWHEQALARLGNTGRVNVALVPDLHTKLYTALTNHGSFAMLGSANFTQRALANREIGLLVTSQSDGLKLVSELNYEANQIYRLPGRRLIYQASFTLS